MSAASVRDANNSEKILASSIEYLARLHGDLSVKELAIRHSALKSNNNHKC